MTTEAKVWRSRIVRVSGGVASLVILSACANSDNVQGSSTGEAAGRAEIEAEVEEQRRLIDQQRQNLEAQARQLDFQLRRIAELERRTGRMEDVQTRRARLSADARSDGLTARPSRQRHLEGIILAQDTQSAPVAPRAPDAIPEADDEPPRQPQAPRAPSEVAPREDRPQGLAPEATRPQAERPTDQLLVDRGGVLLPQGTLQIEPSFDYTHTSSDRVAISGFTIFDAIVIGNIRVDSLERDIMTAAVTARYGVTDRIQAELRVPYVYRRDEEILGVGTNDQRVRSIDGNDFGDISGSLGVQVLDQDDWVPATILRGAVTAPTGRDPFGIARETIGAGGETRLTETPTGSGFWGVGPEATFVWRADPAVFFLGGGYTFNLPETFGEFGEIDPGDTIEWFAGTNFALSELVSLNLSFVNQITSETEQNGISSPGTSTNDARFVIGTSLGLSPNMSLLTSAGIGLTDSSPDFTVTVAVPITFNLF